MDLFYKDQLDKTVRLQRFLLLLGLYYENQKLGSIGAKEFFFVYFTEKWQKIGGR